MAAKKQETIGPTPEQMRHGAFVEQDILDKGVNGRSISIGKAYRKQRMISILLHQGVLSETEYKALYHYQHHADIADRSILKDSLGKRVGQSGGGDGPTITTLNAIRVAADCEKAAGPLVDILRAVVVDDWSLSRWAMEKFGSVRKCRIKRGKREICTYEPKEQALKIARLEIKMVAGWVQAELDA